MSTVKPGGYAAENDRVQNDVKTFAAKLLRDNGNKSAVAADLDAYHTAYTADGGLSQSPHDMNLELASAPGLNKSDIDTLAQIANELPETE
jgi:hypothetical protein